jgi:hypothetical protein
LLATSVFLLVAGCTRHAPAPPQAYPVQGRVLLANGTPVRSGRVVFHPRDNPAGIEAFGEIQKDGSFALTTYQLNDGAVPGPYVVTVDPFSHEVNETRAMPATPIPRRYWDAATSDLAVEIDARENVLQPFQLR